MSRLKRRWENTTTSPTPSAKNTPTNVSRKEFQQLQTHVARLENRLDFLLHINDLDVNVLRGVPDDLLKRAYEVCIKASLQINCLTPYRQFRKWGDLIANFSELEFDRLSDLYQTSEPWVPLYVTCRKILEDIPNRQDARENEEAILTYRYLDKIRKQLVNSINVFMRMQDLRGMEVTDQMLPYNDNFWADSLATYVIREVSYGKAIKAPQ